MLKRDITFEDYNGDTVTETFYFNLSKPELIEMEVEYKEGFGAMIKKVINTKDHKTLMALFKQIVLKAYGVKSDDGRRFIKNEQLREEFSQTGAYEVLYMELATKDDAAVVFLKGILPRDMVDNIDNEAKVIAVPSPSVPPSS